jgi:hypothetical protein
MNINYGVQHVTHSISIYGNHQEDIRCDCSVLTIFENLNCFLLADSKCMHLFQHSTNAEHLSLELQQLTKDPAQISVQVFINASIQIKQILQYALVDRKVKYLLISYILF